MNKFAENLKKLMKEKKVVQSQLAKVLYVERQAISRYMTGKRKPNIDTLILIAKYFDVTIDYLFGLED